MNYKFNLLHHVGVVAKRRAKRRAAVAETAVTAVHEGDDNTPSSSTGRGVKTIMRPTFFLVASLISFPGDPEQNGTTHGEGRSEFNSMFLIPIPDPIPFFSKLIPINQLN